MEISCKELKKELDDKTSLFLLDVRTPEEFQFCSLGGTNIPLGDLPHDFSKLDPAQPIITICHHGVRSYRAAMLLIENGFKNVRSLKGGIDQWSVEIDAAVPRY